MSAVSRDFTELEKIDIIRERLGISYTEAKEALDAAGGDLVSALVHLEQKGKTEREKIQAKGYELIDKVKEIIRQGNVTKIRVKTKDNIVLDLPVTAGVVGVVLAPYLALLGALAALATNCTIEIERVNSAINTTQKQE
ncbi:MAG: DUF4342 domain-containing protein [Firmicutes bacterium]|nr:DUF4342 domain-containing protein [Bacillota bacterium]